MTAFPLLPDVKSTLQSWRTALEGFRLSRDAIDVDAKELANNQILKYNSATKKYESVGELLEDISIAAGAEQSASHSLGVVPKMIIFTYRKGGHVEDGDTENTAQKIYLENRGTTAATVSVLVLP